ncbi:hypothetical protein [Peribacillus simplex]|uniref:hypothetical protein n=1 Tax=Peribacillus simplex TaxID=1478 RepID=UPI00366B863B
MKMVLQAIIGSISTHVIYVVYIKTKNYKPDDESAWDNVEALQNEVEIVGVTPPHFLYYHFWE